MAGPQKRFDAASAAAVKIPPEFMVGDKVFKVKRTGKALKEIIGLVPEGEDPDDPFLNIDLMYQGIALVLVDDGGKHPDPEWLAEEVDFSVAQDFMEQILPSRAEGNGQVISTDQ